MPGDDPLLSVVVPALNEEQRLDLLPSGAGHCIAVRGKVFRESKGFYPALKFDDI